VHPADPAESGPLARDVGGVGAAGAQQPRGQRRVQAAGHRVLRGDAIAGEERPDLERLRRPRRIGAGQAKVEVCWPRPDRQDRVRAGEQDRHPAGAVVGPGRVDDLRPVDPQHRGDLSEEFPVHRAVTQHRRGGEGQPGGAAAQGHQPGTALLDDHPGLARRPASLQPGVAGPQRWMPGEGQLLAGGEDPHPVVRAAGGRREHERGLREVRPVGEPLHLPRRQPLSVEHHGDRVPPVGDGGEDVDVPDRAGHAASMP
jgi:hypothetical protein